MVAIIATSHENDTEVLVDENVLASPSLVRGLSCFSCFEMESYGQCVETSC